MMKFQRSIRIALVGVGNCASSLVQGVEYYRNHPEETGIITREIGGLTVGDIEFTAAFDVDARKVGKPLDEAVFAPPNNAKRFCPKINPIPVSVHMGRIMDGYAPHLDLHPIDRRIKLSHLEESSLESVVEILKETKTDVLVNYLPVGSQQATQFYAQCALDAGLAFLNCIPVFIASDDAWARKFSDRGIPVIGDDIKSQLGATIVHRILARLFSTRGVKLVNSYQLNTGGNSDFLNMLDQERLSSKRRSKTEAVASQIKQSGEASLHIGPSDYVSWLEDKKVCYIRMEGIAFAGQPIELDLKMLLEDSPNSAGVVVDAIRMLYLARRCCHGGPLLPPSAAFCKHPPEQYSDEDALLRLNSWLKGIVERANSNSDPAQ